MQFLGKRLHDPNIWHINRRSTSGAFALGLFCAFLPIPTQMAVAAIGAVAFRVNILISVALVWITNPITIPPIYYYCYRIGLWILGQEPVHWKLTWSWEMLDELKGIWEPLLVGCMTVSVISSIVGFITVRLLWRYSILQRIKQKRQRRAALHKKSPSS